MKCIPTKLEGVLVVEPDVFEDNRGFFMESYNKDKYFDYGIKIEFVQDNHSLSAFRGTIRGMHYQLEPKAQSKLVRVIRGEILNIIVDLRQGSPTFKKWIEVPLSAENKKQLFIPKGFANGFCTLVDNVEIVYKVDEYYAPRWERGFRWDDPEIGIIWPVKNPILSSKDKKAPFFKDIENNFYYKEMP
ncbi:MAG: dTDP-4-dehydrorhamnose 3,5-epimerase [FCB group bacterium]|nr:dTDP-4-dehydrorhamnose 3,5-epimerase [FCB group bacterium]